MNTAFDLKYKNSYKKKKKELANQVADRLWSNCGFFLFAYIESEMSLPLY